jgi:hypothetical protein
VPQAGFAVADAGGRRWVESSPGYRRWFTRSRRPRAHRGCSGSSEVSDEAHQFNARGDVELAADPWSYGSGAPAQSSRVYASFRRGVIIGRNAWKLDRLGPGRVRERSTPSPRSSPPVHVRPRSRPARAGHDAHGETTARGQVERVTGVSSMEEGLTAGETTRVRNLRQLPHIFGRNPASSRHSTASELTPHPRRCHQKLAVRPAVHSTAKS